MDVSNMLAPEGSHEIYRPTPTKPSGELSTSHTYPTRHSQIFNSFEFRRLETPPGHDIATDATQSYSNVPPKNITFELHLEGSSNILRGRLPMRVQIAPHDTVESLVETVKNFYGLYDTGVSFEDINGNALIASFENLTNNMSVYVRIMPGIPQSIEQPEPWGYRVASPDRLQANNELGPMLPPQPAQILNHCQPPSRPGSRISRKQSTSPRLSQGRLNSTHKSRSRSGVKSQGSSFQAGLDELNSDAHNGYSSSDGGAGSVTSSRKARSEQLATADISVDNILEGGRRQKAKFESSELPLFVPPQIPAPNSISSISPQRRSNGLDNPSPFAKPPQRILSHHPLDLPLSGYPVNPQIASAPASAFPFTVPLVPAHGHKLRDRSSGGSFTGRSSLGSNGRFNGSNILPTPDPTVASCISDEDVALQLMRLGDVSNFSHGRTSNSTFDDGFSGRADAASSATSNGDSSDDESDASIRPHVKDEGSELLGPPLKKQRRSLSDRRAQYEDDEYSADEFEGDYDAFGRSESKLGKIKKVRTGSIPGKIKVQGTKKPKSGNMAQPHPMSPSSMPPSRKTSASTLNYQHGLPDEEDLSSKPRCQRCRKSKKGCDRQRPCQRCKDAGIGIEGCVSEDEGNGRKGRYGRHMGVPLKTVVPVSAAGSEVAEPMDAAISPTSVDLSGNKKRKR